MTRKGLSSAAGIALIAIGLVAAGVVSGNIDFSAIGGDDGGDTVEVKDSTLNLAATPLDNSTQVSTTAYAVYSDGDIGTKSLSSGSYTAWSAFTNKDTVNLLAFDSNYYPIESTFSFDGSTQETEDVDVAPIAASGDVSMEARETSGSSDNDDTLSIAAGGQVTIDSLRAEVDTQELYWNAGMIMVDTPDNSNVTVKMPNNEQVAVPDSAPSAVDKAWEAYNPSMGDDSFTEFAQHDSNQIIVEGDDSNDPSETLTFYSDDYQAYKSSSTGDIEYGVEDGSDTNLGLAEQSLSVTVN